MSVTSEDFDAVDGCDRFTPPPPKPKPPTEQSSQ